MVKTNEIQKCTKKVAQIFIGGYGYLMSWRTVDEEGKTSLCCVLLMSDALVADPLKSAFFLGPVDRRPQ